MIDHDAIAARVRQDMKSGTPGLWRVGPVDDTIVTAADGSEVAAVDGDYNEPDLWPIMEANARRIATLPDLEEAYLDLHDEVKRLRAGGEYLSAEEISAIEGANRRWHGEYDTTVSVRWEPYKPDGQRQMKAKGRWQTMTYNGSGYFRWENCDRPAQARQALKGQTK